MEACCGAHHLGRVLLAQGQDVKLMPPKYVKPFVKRDKNDAKDAEACAEACLRPTMRFVQVQSAEQLSMQSLHRYRSRLVHNATQLINQARAFLLERGNAIPQGKHGFAARLPEILEDADNGLRDEMRELLAAPLEEWQELESKITGVNKAFAAEARAVEASRRLTGIPGVGAQTATAVVAAIDDGKGFETGRDFAAWSGLDTLSQRKDRLAAWLRRLLERNQTKKGRKVAIVALAARLARIMQAMLSSGQPFRPEATAA